ncbi:HlyC/CorC family transporter [Limibacillus sp. MBR-115]|jgi:Mg2+/Co2+ transporter CorB|uniref:HlyC/CorC family transporter n=1 Tax=Limibacillus sp. MBR-115 TaxID=3156465 RepID=UPI003392D1DD
METDIILTLLSIIGLLLISAFFSGSETSITAASRPRMHNLEQQGDERAKTVNELWARKERLIGSILLGNNLVNILASALATSALIRLFGDAGVAYATLGMTALILIFAEVLPKTYAIHHADNVALAAAGPLRLVVAVLSPPVRAVQALVRLTLWIFRAHVDTHLTDEVREEELRGAIELHHGPSDEVRAERQMLRSILDLADLEVSEVMTHRRNIVALDADLPPAKLIEQVLAAPYTRIPLYRENQDNIVGVLHAKELFRAVRAHPAPLESLMAGDTEAERDDKNSLDIAGIANKPWFIPDTTDLLSQLEAFRTRHEHFAIVVDEYGEVLGIVTLEDILEEIVGEISDEHDIKVEGVRRLKDGSIEVEGTVTIRDLNRMFEWRLPDEEATTIAGLILHEARRIPEVGQVFLFHGLRFAIKGRKRNQVTRALITPADDGGEDGPARTEERMDAAAK